MHRDFAGETMHRARIMVATRMLMPIGCGPTRYVILPYCKAQFTHAGARSAPGNPKKFVLSVATSLSYKFTETPKIGKRAWTLPVLLQCYAQPYATS